MTFIEAYHVGFVVANLEATMTEFEDLLGVQWARPQHRDLEIRTPAHQGEAKFRFTYSTRASGPALIELIEGPPDTPWDPGEDVAAAFHHIGFWADELAAESARLSQSGAPLELTAGAGPDPAGFAYHQPRHGPRVELVDAARRPAFHDWLAGGDFPQAK